MFSKVLFVAALFGVVANASSSSSSSSSSSPSSSSSMDTSTGTGCDLNAAADCVVDLTIPSNCTTVECVCAEFIPYYDAAIGCYDNCEDDVSGAVTIEAYEGGIDSLEDSYDCPTASSSSSSSSSPSSSSSMDTSNGTGCELTAAADCVLDLTIPTDCTSNECICAEYIPFYDTAIDCYGNCQDDSLGAGIYEAYETAKITLEDSYDCPTASSSSSSMDTSTGTGCDLNAAGLCVFDLTIPSDCTTVECVCDEFIPYYSACLDCYDNCEDDVAGAVTIEAYETAIDTLEDSYDCSSSSVNSSSTGSSSMESMDTSAGAFSAATTLAHNPTVALAVVVGAAMLN